MVCNPQGAHGYRRINHGLSFMVFGSLGTTIPFRIVIYKREVHGNPGILSIEEQA